MSMDIEFTEVDYYNLLNWYEMLFGSRHKPTASDIQTLAKVQLFATQYALDMKLENDSEKDK